MSVCTRQARLTRFVAAVRRFEHEPQAVASFSVTHHATRITCISYRSMVSRNILGLFCRCFLPSVCVDARTYAICLLSGILLDAARKLIGGDGCTESHICARSRVELSSNSCRG